MRNALIYAYIDAFSFGLHTLISDLKRVAFLMSKHSFGGHFPSYLCTIEIKQTVSVVLFDMLTQRIKN